MQRAFRQAIPVTDQREPATMKTGVRPAPSPPEGNWGEGRGEGNTGGFIKGPGNQTGEQSLRLQRHWNREEPGAHATNGMVFGSGRGV